MGKKFIIPENLWFSTYRFFGDSITFVEVFRDAIAFLAIVSLLWKVFGDAIAFLAIVSLLWKVF
ncbi:MAG: hypothetical protein DRR19_20330, partial [Candidatus Parabeggiatoa sp. nov. 1]